MKKYCFCNSWWLDQSFREGITIETSEEKCPKCKAHFWTIPSKDDEMKYTHLIVMYLDGVQALVYNRILKGISKSRDAVRNAEKLREQFIGIIDSIKREKQNESI